LEQACKRYGVSILVGEATRNLIAEEMVLRRLDRSRPKGTTKPEAIYELLGQRGCIPAPLLRATEVFEAAQDLCDRRRWAEASRLFQEAVQLRGGHDPPADRLWRRCERLRVRSSSPS
jgi:adenylate cyclase